MKTSGERYPDIEPYEHGTLDVGDGHRVYWETCGNPDGMPAVVLHGGPGSGCGPWFRRYFDPDAYRVVLFDQRGAGRSTPHASEPDVDLHTNTTSHLLADIELLRQHLGVEKWLLYGVSWGTTLGFAYAELHPERVSGIVFQGITLGDPADIEWITRDVGRLFPEAWSRFRDGVPATERDGSLVEAYSRLLHDPDPAVREQAAQDWCEWEDAHVQVRAEHHHDTRYDDPAFRMGFARLVTHYWRHNSWLEDGIILQEAGHLAGIPGVMVHGRLDVSSPVDNAWRMANAWPGSTLHVVDEAGHSAGDPGVTELIVSALDRFASSEPS